MKQVLSLIFSVRVFPPVLSLVLDWQSSAFYIVSFPCVIFGIVVGGGGGTPAGDLTYIAYIFNLIPQSLIYPPSLIANVYSVVNDICKY